MDNSIALFIFVLFVMFFIFLVIREFWTWYFKLNEIVALLKSIDKHLKEQSVQLAALQRTTDDTYYSNRVVLARMEEQAPTVREKDGVRLS